MLLKARKASMSATERVYCDHCEQSYLASDFNKCSLCGESGGLRRAKSRHPWRPRTASPSHFSEAAESESPVAATWKADVGAFLGYLKVNGKGALHLAKPAALNLFEDGRMSFSSRYDPPGSGWMALFAAIGTAIVVFALSFPCSDG
jgi:hypothetical protein